MKKKLLIALLLLLGFGIGIIVGYMIAHDRYYKTPTYYQCLQLGSDYARRMCIRKYAYWQ